MSDLNIPQYFLCPITQNIMNEPVIDNEGNSYDKKAIEKWLENKNTSPITRTVLRFGDVPTRWKGNSPKTRRTMIHDKWHAYITGVTDVIRKTCMHSAVVDTTLFAWKLCRRACFLPSWTAY